MTAEVGASLTLRAQPHLPDAQILAVGKPERAFYQVALESLEKDGIDASSWSSVGMVRPHAQVLRNF